MANSVQVTQQQAATITAAFSSTPYPPNSSPAAGITVSGTDAAAILNTGSNATLAVYYGYDANSGKYVPIAYAADNTSGAQLTNTIFVTGSGVISASAASALKAAYANNPDAYTPQGQTGNIFERGNIASFTGDFTLSPGRDDDEALNFVASGATANGTVYFNRPIPSPKP